MGTHSVINIFGEDRKPLASIYTQYDGYPEGVGSNLYNFLLKRKITNGYGMDAQYMPVSNGMNDLAAQLLVHLKGPRPDNTGHIYLEAPAGNWNKPIVNKEDEKAFTKEACDIMDSEYCYNIFRKDDSIEINVWEPDWPDYPKLLYSGDVAGMRELCEGNPEETIAAKLDEIGKNRAGGQWVRNNIAFDRLEEAAIAYKDSGAEQPFMEFIEDPANPVPELFEIQSQMLDMRNIAPGQDYRLDRILSAIEDYATIIDSSKISFGDWMKRETGLDPDEMKSVKTPRMS